MGKKINLYWWSERKIQKKQFENYGDLIGPYLVEKISDVTPHWVRASNPGVLNFFNKVYATVGSILSHTGRDTIVWGSGILNKGDVVKAKKILAVRGPLSRKRLLEQHIECPEIYGDPAILLPCYFYPKVKKSFRLGVIPHIIDYKNVKEQLRNISNIKVINFNSNDVEKTTSEILECDQIFSSSLHGIIVAHSYGIPAVQVKFSDNIAGDGIKYKDYYLSMGLEPYKPTYISLRKSLEELIKIHKEYNQRLPSASQLKSLQDGLMAVCPFKKAAK